MTNLAQDVSVLICAYRDDRWNDLQRAVESLRRQTVAPHEILLIIDHNPALAMRCRAELAGVRVVENRARQGISGARNTGIAEATGRFIAFLDDDAVAAGDWLERLAGPLADPRVVGVGGSSLPAWDEAQPGWFPAEFFWTIGCSYRGLPAVQSPVRNIFGGTVVYRREIFPAVGGFVSEIGRNHTGLISCEETEFCIRVNQHFPGRHFIYEPGAVMYHRIPAARGRFGFFTRRCFDEGRSKALMAAMVGQRDGLSEERSYSLRTLPSGVARNLLATIRNRDAWGLARAGVIAAGLTVTAAGYGYGLLQVAYTHLRGGQLESTPMPIRLSPVSTVEAASLLPNE